MDAAILGEYAVTLGKMFNNAMLVPEIYGYGDAVMNSIFKNGYWNVYKRRQRGTLALTGSQYGWRTDMTTKKTMITLGRHEINQGYGHAPFLVVVGDIQLGLGPGTTAEFFAHRLVGGYYLDESETAT